MKIAIVKLSALGDIIHAMVGLQFLKQFQPDIEIDWLVEARFAEILQYNPDIRHILPINLRLLKTQQRFMFQQLQQLRDYASNNYDLVIDAQGLLKSAIVAKIIGKRVAGFDQHSARESLAAWFYNLKIACSYSMNTIDRNAAILSQPLNFSISSTQILVKQPFLFFQNENPEIYQFLPSNKTNIVFVIGSSWESRNYPKEKFVAIAQTLQCNCLVLWGSESEKQKAQWMVEQTPYIQFLPQLSLNDLKALIAHADLVIGNDTGPTHMAWGLNKPSITLFGCTPLSRVYQTQINKVLKSSSIVNPYRLNKQDDSVKEIAVRDIVTVVETLLKRV